jgi:hypothetical protein
LKYFRKTFLTVAAIFLFAGFTNAASAFVGNWSYDNNPGGLEVLWLGDSSDDTYLYLRGTDRYCGRPGASYARMRSVLRSTGGDQVNWWFSDECDDGYVRVCVSNSHGNTACSTYGNGGWH